MEEDRVLTISNPRSENSSASFPIWGPIRSYSQLFLQHSENLEITHVYVLFLNIISDFTPISNGYMSIACLRYSSFYLFHAFINV